MPSQITQESLETCLQQALSELRLNDAKLLEINGSEWSVAHRLAVYLEPMFRGWHVDCEYNRQGESDPKKRVSGRRVRPDITVHQRTKIEIEHNLLVIEIKKKKDKRDAEKACEYTSAPSGRRSFQYQWGVTMSFWPELKLDWFSNGQPHSPTRHYG